MKSTTMILELKKGKLIFLDSETCGLHGMPVLLQWAVDEGPIHLYSIWKQPVRETLAIVEAIAEKTVIMFNAAFDWLHLCKLHTIWSLCDPDWIPEEHIEEIAAFEQKGMDGKCLKPAGVLDLLMYARKGPYQSLMGRKDIRIRRVPVQLAESLADTLEKEIHIDEIYFARRANKHAPRWKVLDIQKPDGTVNKDFKDVVLSFAAASGLKYLAEHVLGYEPKYHFSDVEVDKAYWPKELGYAPRATAVSSADKNWEVLDEKGEVKGWAWPGVIQHHIEHWASDGPARDYANDDIVYTRGLYEHFEKPEANDDDSVLTCMVAAVRWRGYRVDLDGIRGLKEKALRKVKASPVQVTRISEVKRYLQEALDDTEMVSQDVNQLASTGRKILEKIKEWKIEVEEDCFRCLCEGCERCGGTGKLKPGPHPAAIRAGELLEAKMALKEIELYNKLLLAGRLHASFKVIGTLSSRMSGADGLNPQGIKSEKTVRSCFPLSWPGQQLCAGDFSGFELTIADAVFNDEGLRRDLMTGRKVHAVFGMGLFNMTYEEVLATADTANDLYKIAKTCVFALLYGAEPPTIARNARLPEEDGIRAYERFGLEYPGIKEERDRITEAFHSMKQPGGLGTQVYWEDPAEYIESFLGFRRYFTLENQVNQVLFRLANKPPKHWKDAKIKVVRRDRVQSACGAAQSALFGCAFGLQA
ncbi:MAG: hypothetical protein KDA84_28360, partial [Planctomycetaceae bacterium]|nr:hypothetical protein [Planctomycetaceae bacterium]